MNREKIYQGYHAILTMALTWAITLVINETFQLRVPILSCALFSLISVGLMYLFYIDKKNVVRNVILLSLFPALILIFWMKGINFFKWCNELLQWCQYYNGSEEIYKASFAYGIIIGNTVIGTLLLFYIVKNQVSKIILAVAIMIAMILLSINEIHMIKAVVGICVFYVLTVLVELSGTIYSKKMLKQEKKEGILYLAPICLLLAVLSILLPSKAEAIQWSGVKKAYRIIMNQVDSWMVDIELYYGKWEDEFSVSLTGYSENSSDLDSSDLTNDKNIALLVTDLMAKTPVYLIGSVSDYYTGNRWEKRKLEYVEGEPEYLLDYMELVYALSRQDLDTLQNYAFVKRRKISTEFYNFKSRTFFYPLKSSLLKVLSGDGTLITNQANITFDRMLGRGTASEYIFYEMNLQGEGFQRMLKEADTFSYQNSNVIHSDMIDWVHTYIVNDKSKTNIFNQDYYNHLQERANNIQKQYTILPNTLPDRVKELATEITANYDTSYDKLKAIEAYLQTFTYTLHPGEFPKGKDFIDYFLFESKEGYCTSFASSMAILGRCIGIPTRYVEGFVVQFDEKTDTNKYIVRNNQAHAWAEAYIEGVGWIPFEVTPTYSSRRYVKWNDTVKQSDGNYSSYDRPQEPEYMTEGNTTDQKHIDEDKINTKNMLTSIVIFFATVGIIISSFLLYFIFVKHQYKKMFDKSDDNKKMYLTFLRILHLLRHEGFILQQQETILMLALRVNNRFDYDKVSFLEVVTIFMRYRYADATITKEELEQVILFYKSLFYKQSERQKRIQLWFSEFMFLTRKKSYDAS